MLRVISRQEAEDIVDYKFVDKNYNLLWTDWEDTNYIVNLLSRKANILEIGTYLGHTTQNIAENTTGHIVTIDICQDMGASLKYQNHELLPREKSGSVITAKNVTKFLVESDEFFQPENGYPYTNNKNFDGIFIDGDHSFDQVRKDSKNAFNRIAKEGIIVWHDVYNNDGIKCPKTLCQPDNTDVTDYLESIGNLVYKIERSWVAFYVNV